MFIYINRLLLKPKKYNYFTKEEEDPISIPLILIFVTDLIYWIVQVLKEDLERLVVSIQNTGLMEPVEL